VRKFHLKESTSPAATVRVWLSSEPWAIAPPLASPSRVAIGTPETSSSSEREAGARAELVGSRLPLSAKPWYAPEGGTTPATSAIATPKRPAPVQGVAVPVSKSPFGIGFGQLTSRRMRTARV